MGTEMSIGTGRAAETLAYYIKLALQASGEKLSAEMKAEIDDAVEAFKSAERADYQRTVSTSEACHERQQPRSPHYDRENTAGRVGGVARQRS